MTRLRVVLVRPHYPGNLGAVAAVDQHGTALAPQHRAGQPAPGQGHHPARPQQHDLDHRLTGQAAW
jgi:hypothetical protein